MAVVVPATSANLGPGFDAMGMALSLHAEVGIVGTDPMPDGARAAEDTHPAQVAFRRAGGEGTTWVRSAIPMGRGLGFSGAVRVGGVVAAEVQQVGAGWERGSSRAVEIGAELEGHADNVAPSLWGGVVVVCEGEVSPVPVNLHATYVAWIPDFTTSTNESRGRIPASVPLADAVHNIGRAAMLATAFVTGDPELLGRAVRDRLHQDLRLDASPRSRAALRAGTDAGAWAGWLSGSGPTVLLACDPDRAVAVAAALPEGGTTRLLEMDRAGARIV